MESRKIVLMNLLAGKEWRCRRREQTCGRSGEGGTGANGESSTDIYTLPWVKQVAGEELLHNTGTQPGALRQFRRVGWAEEGGARGG